MHLFPHDRWLLCEPLFYDVTYEINAWMSVERRPVRTRAHEQWQQLHHTILRLGGWVEYIAPQEGLPDMVFTANAGLIKGKSCVLSSFRHKERQGEESHFAKWFEEHGYTVLRTKNNFEGEGDALFDGETLFGGYGFRTEQKGLDEAGSFLNVSRVVPCNLIDPRFYHIDTCFCPIGKGKAIFVPSAFSKESRAAMEKEIELLAVPESDAVKYACNAIPLGSSIIIPDGCNETGAILESNGLTPYFVPMGEFLKAGGAAKCLTIKLNRD